MYLHLGDDIAINSADIIGIFDIDTTTVSKTTRDFLKNAEQKGKVKYINEKLPNSFIVCKTDSQDRVYISQISTPTLLKRSNLIYVKPNERMKLFGK